MNSAMASPVSELRPQWLQCACIWMLGARNPGALVYKKESWPLRGLRLIATGRNESMDR